MAGTGRLASSRRAAPRSTWPTRWEQTGATSGWRNDERDAADLVDLLRRGRLAEAWIAPSKLREVRELVRYRGKLVQLRSNFKAQVHSVLAKRVSPFAWATSSASNENDRKPEDRWQTENRKIRQRAMWVWRHEGQGCAQSNKQRDFDNNRGGQRNNS
jgi:hypothetical protein